MFRRKLFAGVKAAGSDGLCDAVYLYLLIFVCDFRLLLLLEVLEGFASDRIPCDGVSMKMKGWVEVKLLLRDLVRLKTTPKRGKMQGDEQAPAPPAVGLQIHHHFLSCFR